MSLNRETREAIKQYILEKISENDSDLAKHASEAYGLSLNSIYRYLTELEDAGEITRVKKGEYHLNYKSCSFVLRRDRNELNDEMKAYKNTIFPVIIEHLPDNVVKIWDYAFSEMMNNAIDHSCSEKVLCVGLQNSISTIVAIVDYGIGIFKNIKDWFGFETVEDAMSELFKGKLTTDTSNHSGEGIFYTSRILDEFAAISDGKVFSHNKYEKIYADVGEIPEIEDWAKHKGTIIIMKLANNSKKEVSDVFDKFSDEDFHFTKTDIPLRNFFETYPVSRSQAKRLCSRMEDFKEITLDFQEINNIGQGFAHELYCVFHNKYPNIVINSINCCEKVMAMIKHVTNT